MKPATAPSPPLSAHLKQPLGPILMLDDIREGQMHLAALFIAPNGQDLPPIELDGISIPAQNLATYQHVTIWRCRFIRPATEPSHYRWNGDRFDLAGCPEGAMQIAYVSCNGEEHGDLTRDGDERNAMWRQLAETHDQTPLSLLLHGGDQVYADEVTLGHPLSHDWPDRLPRDPSRGDLADLRTHLRERFLDRYIAVYDTAEHAHLAARVPSLMQWDDHDICDGWGSLRRSRTYSPVGQTLFDCAREAALLFQHGCVDGDLPARFADPTGLHLGWSITAPGLRLLAPDLRSERSRREVMGTSGWRMMEDAGHTHAPGRTFVMSSVPVLGPRLSVLEWIMMAIPSMQKYEDDLRDQWQSRAHRDSWQHLLEILQRIASLEGQEVTVLSGEIHLAARGEMALGAGRVMHQLVASGISHRAPPKAWARFLDMLARFGDSPLPGHPIQMRPIPGQSHRYVAERNYLLLRQSDGNWQAQWALEDSGPSTWMPL